MDWMEATGVLKMWFRQEQGLMEDHPDLKRFYGRVVGDSLELMPLDKRLNKDVHKAVNQHYILTNDLPKDDERRFGLETPKQVASSYKRIWDPDTGISPSSDRIAHDIQLVFTDAIPRIIKGRGFCLDDNNQKGRRHDKNTTGKKSTKWGKGGKRTLVLDNYGTYAIHSDARVGMKVKIEKSLADFEGVKVKIAKSLEDFDGVMLEVLGESTADALGYVVEGDGDGDGDGEEEEEKFVCELFLFYLRGVLFARVIVSRHGNLYPFTNLHYFYSRQSGNYHILYGMYYYVQ